jgi:predicted nucleic acid-binding protein
MPTAKYFADTNVAIYAVDADVAKREKALAILASRPVISTQVVNEYLNVLLTKRKLDRASANELARALMATSEVASVTPDITDLAMHIGERHQVSHWDALIVAAALATGCDTLYSEDLQDGQVFEERLTVQNPFTD